MALDAVVFPQDPFGYTCNKDLYNLLGENWISYDHDHDHLGLVDKFEDHYHHQHQEQQASFDFLGNQTDHHQNIYPSSPPSMVPHFNQLQLSNIDPSPPDAAENASPTPHGPTTHDDDEGEFDQLPVLMGTMTMSSSSSVPSSTSSTRQKRRRARSKKNKEEIENQRMTHIAVERNRRKQMNDYLSHLRSLMPDSYVQRGDQASIIGGAINYVKELEQQVQFLGAQIKQNKNKNLDHPHVPFSDFFTFPQYTTSSSSSSSISDQKYSDHHDHDKRDVVESKYLSSSSSSSSSSSTSKVNKIAADIEVTMVETHANLKVRSKRFPKQLFNIVSGLHSLRLTILHLNVSTLADIVLYSLSLKVEDECTLTSVDEIATAVYQMLARIHQEALMC